jgi:hypothetical protein
MTGHYLALLSDNLRFPLALYVCFVLMGYIPVLVKILVIFIVSLCIRLQ